MASPGELVKIISQVTGINEATVASTHRYLRDAGVITKGGRGNSSARMTSLDAANLLIALMAAVSINDSAEIAERYGKLQLRTSGAICKVRNTNLKTDAANFASGMEALFESIRSNELAMFISDELGRHLSNEDLNYSKLEIEISVYRPEPRASICVNALVEGEKGYAVPVLNLEFERRFKENDREGLSIDPAIRQEESAVGLKERRWVGLDVVMAIAKIL